MKWTTLHTLTESLLTQDFERCYLCKGRATEVHHIFHGADKGLSEELHALVPLCRECHYDIHHGNGFDDRMLKEDAQREYLIKIFGRCYL